MANQIKYYRRAAKMTQVEVAKALDISIDTLWRWENGSGEPRWQDIKIMCQIFTKENIVCTPEKLMDENPTSTPAGSDAPQGSPEN